MKKRRVRPQLRIGGFYILVNGERVEVDPFKGDFPDRFKKIWAEAMLGCKVELVKRNAP